jgi:hypothetical protein
MKSNHQIVKIRIDVIKHDETNITYTASNEDLGVFVKGASFREVLGDLRDILALRLKHSDLSLHFYSAESSQKSRPGVLPGATFTPHQTSRENRFN